MNKKIFFLIIFASLFFQCSKKSGTSDPYYKFFNPKNELMYYDIYGSYEDFFNNTNAVKSGKIEAKSEATFAESDLTVGKKYYVGTHNEDYTVTTWNSDKNDLISFVFQKSSNTSYGIPGSASIEKILFNVNQSIKWKAIDAYNTNGVSVWDTLSYNKDLNIQCSRLSINVHYNNKDNVFIPGGGYITISQTNVNKLLTMIFDNGTFFVYNFNKYYGGTFNNLTYLQSNYTPSNDTLFFILPIAPNAYCYKLTRQ